MAHDEHPAAHERANEAAPEPAANGARDARPRPPARALADLRLLAISHHTATLGGFESAALDAAGVEALYARLRPGGLDAIVLATCNRVELYWRSLGARSDLGVEEVFLRATGAAGASREPGALLRAAGEQAAHHLFRVACGLDSLLIGEGEVLGQVRLALEASGAGEFVAGVFRAALRCGGLARAETAIGEGALSVASAGAHQVAAALAGRPGAHVVVVGAGDTGSRAAKHLRGENVPRLTIVNRTFERARALAGTLGAGAATLTELPAVLADADGLVVAAHAPAFLVTSAMARDAMASRPDRPLVVADVSMPRAVDPAVRALAGVTLHDLLGLEGAVRENRARREREVPRVETVIRRELNQLRGWAHQQMLRPVMADFRERAEAIRIAELRRAVGDGLAPSDALEQFTRRLVDRMIAIPIAAMRESRPETLESCGLECMRRNDGEAANGTG